MAELMTEKELRKELQHFNYNENQGIDLAPSHVDFLVDLIESQKRAYAKKIIGKPENHTDQCTTYRKASQNGSICICNAKQRNKLRLEMWEANKV